ncbi:pyridoxamine 5'-phosphate oxidase [Glaciihabitans arcticus]|uniref:Pyridoxamine 5'-phosphate oxidase n=1 Tax=Glaciihabitans arcticus TaxID=2668039 RepID=A0A4Q9GRT3_9MICO|nr:pyridoxal 5'-phosphate synthase [Glaciihabitans arcticus]TBN56298.1 pyridoxamine 5'-phosphate oxidase [Glaciihabitans arcticus]
MSEPSLRDRLRALKVFGEDMPELVPDAAPHDPLDLLRTWLEEALAQGVAQPHAMTLATSDAAGAPSARTLLLKDLTPEGVWFASLSSSPKGRDLEANPRAAVVLYWREQGRQIRVTGAIEKGPRDVARADFLQRHPKARATAIAGHQSEPIGDDHDELQADAQARVDADDRFVPEEWVAWILRPQTVEFWQAARHREQTRLRYEKSGGDWQRDLLWP